MHREITLINNDLQGRWRGILHHVTGEHDWLDGCFSNPQCEHEPMEEPADGKTWLVAKSPAHMALGKVIFEQRFMNNVHRYTNFR